MGYKKAVKIQENIITINQYTLACFNTLYEYIFGVPTGEKQKSATKRVIPAQREHEYCRYIRLGKGISTFNFSSTAAGEGINRTPGCARSPLGRGYKIITSCLLRCWLLHMVYLFDESAALNCQKG